MSKILKFVSLFAAIGSGLAACTGPERFNGQNSYEKTQRGAVIGGIIGTVSGMITGIDARDRRNLALKGAILSSSEGAIIGNQLDKQETELRSAMGDENVEIKNTGDQLIVTLPQDILFGVDSTMIRPDMMTNLRALSANLRRHPNTTVQVIGHTDNTGGAHYNQLLSSRRANKIASALIGSGLARYRIIAMGRGEAEPVASNLTVEGRAQNRRMDIVILPNTVTI